MYRSRPWMNIGRGQKQPTLFGFTNLSDCQAASRDFDARQYEELLRLTQQVERLEVRRVECLAELARLRGTSLTETN